MSKGPVYTLSTETDVIAQLRASDAKPLAADDPRLVDFWKRMNAAVDHAAAKHGMSRDSFLEAIRSGITQASPAA